MRSLACLAGAVAVVALCAGSCGPRKTIISPGDTTEHNQWERGVWLYGQHCAGCHGDNGEGSEDDAPAIAGEGRLAHKSASEDSERTATFDTAADVFAYVKAEMPPLAPGSLSDEQYWDVMLYVLKQAEISAPAEDLTAANAAGEKLH